MPVGKVSKKVESQTNPKNFLQYFLVIALIVAAFVVGNLYQKVKYLEGGTTSVKTAQEPATTQAPQVQAQGQEVQATIDQVKEAFNKSLIKFGDTNKKIVFIEVADPSCPYCHIAAGLNNELNKQVGDRFTLVADGGTYVAPVVEMKKLVDQGQAAFAWLFTNGHGNGELGTKALYCANEKGKFWPVHDLMMTNKGYDMLNETVQNDKSKAQVLADFLSSAFDPQEMSTCLSSGKYDDRLQVDSGLASGLGISGTPGFYINETKYAGAYSYTDMKSTVDSLLN